jgi:hypothetical protein
MRTLTAAMVFLLGACSAPTDERATEDGSVAHPRCESCHVGDFEAASDPPHLDQLPTTCFVCHTQSDWQPAVLAHDFYPLTGAHLSARCLGCHVAHPDENEPRYEGTDGACVACHRADYDRSTFPGHARFPVTCAECHSTSAWSPTLHPPPDAWLAPDAGSSALPIDEPLIDEISHASGHREIAPRPTPPRPPPRHRHPPPSTSTTAPPPTPVPDVTSGATAAM